MKKQINLILPVLLFFCLMAIFLTSFLSENYIKGTFQTDEPAIVILSLDPTRKLPAIFRFDADLSQPPLDDIIRNKIYLPIGRELGVTKIYPEFFHRFLSLLWWILPIGYFCLNLKDFSRQKKLTISLAFLLIAGSQFFRFYLAEARHYSAIAATYATMIIILLSDKISYYRLRYRFLIISLLPPLLHLISFPYYFVLVVFFFYRLAKESFQEHKAQFFDLLTIFSVYLLFIIWMYFQISKIAANWQHPSLNNFNIGYLNSYLKWTLDWIFYEGPLYPIFNLIPKIIKENLIITFGLLSIPLFGILIHKVFFARKKLLDVTAVFPLIITFVWPITVQAVIFRSGMFSGERYSIDILVVIFFGIAALVTRALFKIQNIRIRYLSLLLVLALPAFFLFPKVISAKYFNLQTPENLFVKEYRNILMDNKSILIADNGAYSSSIPTQALIYNIPMNVDFIACRYGTFFSNSGQNIFNDWLRQHLNQKVYFLTTGNELQGSNKLLWKSGLEKLYLLNSPINNTDLCQNQKNFDNCLVRCTKGADLSPDGRSIPGTAPHLDIYRH